MKYLGRFSREVDELPKIVEQAYLKPGINDIADHLIKVLPNGNVEYVIDKVCDHAGGKLILKGSNAICPLHGWQLNLDSLQYNNSHECKKKINFDIDENKNIRILEQKGFFVNPFKAAKQGEVKLRWLNHATIYIECNGISLVTDPWLFGPAFITGWWLTSPSPRDSIELLKHADYIFISHNHPDHLHAETLAVLSKDKKILVADFTSKSTENYLLALGFSNVQSLPFNEIFEIGNNFQISILKSGDFRDDSGAYVCVNGHEILLTVDSNFLNFNVLPKHIDMLLTSFAGGASGFPLCFDDYSEEEKKNICNRNKGALKALVKQYLQATCPSYYMPYAGMFNERAGRDSYIKENNSKNRVIDFEDIAKKHNAVFIEPVADQEIYFNDGSLTVKEIAVDYLSSENVDFYIKRLKKEYPYKTDTIINYFRNSKYHGNQIIQIIPTDDNFEKRIDDIVFADFKKNIFKVLPEDDLVFEKEGYKVMQLKVRPESFMCVIENNLPWEDFSIGFQMRIKRVPNVYESDFWYHFTNTYIERRHFRYSSFCGACTVINQNPIWIDSYDLTNQY